MHPAATSCASLHDLALTLPSHVAAGHAGQQHVSDATTCRVQWKFYSRRVRGGECDRVARAPHPRPRVHPHDLHTFAGRSDEQRRRCAHGPLHRRQTFSGIGHVHAQTGAATRERRGARAVRAR